MKLITEIKVEQIESSYRGKNGCSCGCNGDYFYSEQSITECKMELTDEEIAVNQKEIAKHLKHINRNLDRAELSFFSDNSICIEVENDSQTSVTRIFLKSKQEMQTYFASKRLTEEPNGRKQNRMEEAK